MWSSVVVRLILVVASSRPSLAAGTRAHLGDSCSILNYTYHNKAWLDTLLLSQVWDGPGAVRWLRKDGQELPVEVWGGGGAPRAAAALLHAGLRHALRYDTVLYASEPELCNISSLAYYQSLAVVAPAASWASSCPDDRLDLDTVVGRTAGPAAPISLRLFGYLSREVRDQCSELASAGFFYANVTALEKCLFLTPILNELQNDSCTNCTLLLARNVTDNDIKEAQKFEEQPNIKIIYHDDLSLRRRIDTMKNYNISFLFLYEDIWDGVEGIVRVQPPPNYNPATQYHDLNINTYIRVGDGSLMRKYAPPIYEVMKHFQPTTDTLRQILNYEQKYLSIEEAACTWALKNEMEFKSLFINAKKKVKDIFLNYFIIVLFCNENEKKVYETFLSSTLREINDHAPFKLNIGFHYVDCESEYSAVYRVLRELNKPEVVGIVVWGWIKGAEELVNIDLQMQSLPIIFAGPVHTDVELGPWSQSASGNLIDLAQAYRRFFHLSDWNRIAILSDDTKYAKSFKRHLTNTKEFTYQEIIISKYQTIVSHLESFLASDARIFLINSNWIIANDILCAALQLGMINKKKYIWIVREGNGFNIQCLNDNSIEDMEHFTLGLDWRGGTIPTINSTLLERIRRKLSKQKHQNKNSPEIQWDEIVIPTGGSFLVDAVLQLAHGFINFSISYPTHLFDLRGADNARLIKQIIENISVKGVTQVLKLNEQHYIKDPLVFVDLWRGKRRCSLAVWQVLADDIIEKWSMRNFFEENRQIKDRTFCVIASPGGAFAPRCHDFTIALFGILLVLICIAFIIASLVRVVQTSDLRQLKYHIRITTALDTYLIERTSVKILHEIGSGRFGKVYFAELKRNGSDTMFVAAKEPNECIESEETHKFLQEAFILAPLRHENVIKLIGVCHKDGPPMVLMEYALYLDLKRYLVERRQLAYETTTRTIADDISDKTLTSLARQAAAALDYLSARKIIHRDVRAANCLIDKERSLKLADFGMARLLNKQEEYMTRRCALFPILWMAPESLAEGIFSPASDVWSLGVLILEIVMLGTRPFGKWSPNRVYLHVIKGGYAPLPPDISLHTRQLVTACWERDPQLRPSAAGVRNYLTSNKDALTLTRLSPVPPITHIEDITLVH